MDEPERVVKELWYSVSQTGGSGATQDYPTAEAAANAAIASIRDGAYAIHIYRVERLTS